MAKAQTSLSKARTKVRTLQRRCRLWLVRSFLSYDRTALLAAIRRCGIGAGDSVMVHCAFEERHGFRGSAGDVIDCLVEAVGQDGGLYMVSMPYQTSTIEYLSRNPVFDVRRTPSRMGLISEFFRRRPGVLRSEHPTHPLLGLGRAAGEVLANHANCLYPCGPGSPFERLLQLDGKVLFLNASMSTLTFFHYLEHLVAPLLSFAVYRPQSEDAVMIDSSGTSRRVPVKVFSPDCIHRRRPDILQRWLRQEGLVRQSRIGASVLIAVDMRRIVKVVEERAARGEFFYDMLTSQQRDTSHQ